MPSFRSYQPSTPFPVLCAALMLSLGACGDDGGGTTEPENEAPSAVAGADTAFERGPTLALDGSASSDPDAADELTYEWSVESRPAGSVAAITGANSATASFEPDLQGDYVVALTVSDGEASDTDELLIEVRFPRIDEDIEEDRLLTNSAASADQPDYHIPQDLLIQVNARLTIEPGVTVEIGENSRLQINDVGVLVADGEPALPIRFIGSGELPGWHEGLRIASDSLDNILDHVEFAYGGRDGWANLWLDGAVTLTNSILRDSETVGLHVTGTGSLHAFGNNDFVDNAITGLRLPPEEIGHIDAASSFTAGDTTQRIFTQGGDVVSSQTWAAEHRYFLEDIGWIRIYDALTIEPGFDLLIGDDGRVQVDEDGTLTAIGTAADSILFIGAVEEQGYWDGIHIVSDTETGISFARVGYGGRIFAAVYVDGTATVTNSHIHDSGGHGLQKSSNGTLTHSGNTFDNNAGEDLFIVE
jgi:hypothetical protein